MTRRELLRLVTAVVPAASIRVEPEIKSTDLIVIEHPHRLSQQELANLRRTLEHGIFRPDEIRAREDMPRILVVEDGTKLHVHRNIARVEVPDHV